MRTRFEWLGLVVVSVLVVAFVVSFATGLLREQQPVTPHDTADAVITPQPPEGQRVRVEVLNASGTAGLARAVTNRLRDQGYDVVFFGNARGFGGDTSYVIDRAGDARSAESVAAALGIARVESRPDPALMLDVTVIVARDWLAAPAQ